MKKLMIYFLLLSSFTIATADERNGPNDQGIYQVFNHQAHFKGRLLMDGCKIEPRDVTINLGEMSVSDLGSKGESEWREGKLNFEQCNMNNEDDNIKVSGVYLQIPAQGGASNVKEGLWKNDARNSSYGADGVSIEMQVKGDGDYQRVTPEGTGTGENDGIKATILDDHTASYTIRGRMVRDPLAGALTTGLVETVIYFNVVYK